MKPPVADRRRCRENARAVDPADAGVSLTSTNDTISPVGRSPSSARARAVGSGGLPLLVRRRLGSGRARRQANSRAPRSRSSHRRRPRSNRSSDAGGMRLRDRDRLAPRARRAGRSRKLAGWICILCASTIRATGDKRTSTVVYSTIRADASSLAGSTTAACRASRSTSNCGSAKATSLPDVDRHDIRLLTALKGRFRRRMYVKGGLLDRASGGIVWVGASD